MKHNLLQDWDDTDALVPSDHRYVPSAVFTDPQIASVGLTENEARAKGLNIKVKIQDFGDVAYGWAMEDTTGIAKIIVDDDSGLIVGAHIMGHQASSLIQPLIQAMASTCLHRTWRAASTGSTPRCPRSSRTRCLRSAANHPGPRPRGIEVSRPRGAQRFSTLPYRQTARAITHAATNSPTIRKPTNSRSAEPIAASGPDSTPRRSASSPASTMTPMTSATTTDSAVTVRL